MTEIVCYTSDACISAGSFICIKWCLTCQHSFVISSFTSVHFPTLYSMPYCFWLSKSPDNLCSHFLNLFYSFFDMSSGNFVIVTASDIWKNYLFIKVLNADWMLPTSCNWEKCIYREAKNEKLKLFQVWPKNTTITKQNINWLLK